MPLLSRAWEQYELFGLSEARSLMETSTSLKVSDDQLRTLLELAAEDESMWAAHRDAPASLRRAPNRRYTLEEVAGAEVAVGLLESQCGWTKSGRIKANTTVLRRACDKLRSYGFRYPLIQTRLSWDPISRRYLFNFDGFIVEAETGQSRIHALLERPSFAQWDPAKRQAILLAASYALAGRSTPTGTALIESSKSSPTTTPAILLG